jgi:hypothetical protein
MYIDDVRFGTGTGGSNLVMTVVDPLPELQKKTGIATDAETLARFGTPVLGIAADRATRGIIRVLTDRAGERIRLRVLNDQGQLSGSTQDDGGIGTVDTGAVPLSAELQLVSVETSRGAMAFAIYRAPPDFTRAGRDDSAKERYVTLEATSLDNPQALATMRL